MVSDESDLSQIDKLCSDFEQKWIADDQGKPVIVDFLGRVPDELREEALQRLLQVEIELLERTGVAPDWQAYLKQFPTNRMVVQKVMDNHLATLESSDAVFEDSSNKIGKYEILREIGRGGQAVTYLALDPDLQRKVVVKEYHACNTESERERVLNEGRALARVKSRYVAGCLTVERKDKLIHLVMEYVRGDTLRKVGQNKQLDFGKAAQVIARVAEGLYDVHLCGLIHRDIKPSNILVMADGSPRIVDFGLAASMATDDRDNLGGTPQFMAPEQAAVDAERIDQRTDIFGLGATLYWLLTGKPPYTGDNPMDVWEKAKSGKFDSVDSLNSDVPPELLAICERAMALEPVDRYSSAAEMAVELREYCGFDTARSADSDTGFGSKRVRAKLGPNPFPGLAAFTLENADDFHGRNQQIKRVRDAFIELLQQKSRDEKQPRILPILGPSGSGKSSLAQAGLLANLQHDPPESFQSFQSIVMTPGNRPLESLSAELARLATNDASPIGKMREFETELRQEAEDGTWQGLRRVVSLLPNIAASPIVLLVDQFEETFSLCEDATERFAFVGNLLDAASDASNSLSCILTLRTDFIGQTQDISRLNTIIAERGIIVPAMNEDELRAAISQPAQDAGYPLPSSVIELLISQTHGREGALPLLQFALNQIWEGIVAGEQPNDTLKRIGGVGGALAGEAQRIYESLDPTDQVIARRAVLELGSAR